MKKFFFFVYKFIVICIRGGYIVLFVINILVVILEVKKMIEEYMKNMLKFLLYVE